MSKKNKIKLSIADEEYTVYIEMPKDKFNSNDTNIIIEQLKNLLSLLMKKENKIESCQMIQTPKKEEVQQIPEAPKPVTP